MNLVCPCGKTEESQELPKTWIVSKYRLKESDEPETGKNPIGHGTVRAFCSGKCEQDAKDEYFSKLLKK